MKTNKKEQLLFVTRICEILFCVAIIGSMVYYLLNGQTAMPLLLIKQWIALDAFVFIGLLLGATDVVVRTRKSLVRTLIVAVVLDTFLGSGTTAVACKELNRHYIGFELNEEYFKIAQDRLNGITQIERKEKDNGILNIFDFIEEV